MAARKLTYGVTGFNGGFTDPRSWLPNEAPVNNTDQVLEIASGVLRVTSQPWTDYELRPAGNFSTVVFTNQTMEAEASVVQTAPNATYFVEGANGLNSAADWTIGGSGAQGTATFLIAPGSVFRNNGPIDVDGNLLIRGGGAFINNGSVQIDNGTLLVENFSLGEANASIVIGERATVEFVGFTNSNVSFERGETGRLLLDTPLALNNLGPVKGFDKGDEIVVQGAAVSSSFNGDASGGTLTLLGSNGTNLGQVRLAGEYAQGTVTAVAEGGKTVIRTTVELPKVEPDTPPTSTSNTQAIQTTQAVLDLDQHGRRDAQVTVNGLNDVTLTMTKLTVRDTALQRAEFLDGALVFDGQSPNGRYVPDADASAVARMYYTVLGRAPEFGGAHFWVEDYMEAQNLSIRDLAPNFYTSPEFRLRYGENTSDLEIVTLLYRNVLGRDGSDSEKKFWTDFLASGNSRTDIVVNFSESTEHQLIRYNDIEESGIRFRGDQAFL